MAGRQWFADQKYTSQGIVECDFSFVTNNTSNPDPLLFRGCGGVTGSSGVAGTANSGPTAVASILRTGVGIYVVTLQDGYRFVQALVASIDDAADQLAVRVSAITNEGAGYSVGISFTLTVRSAGTATESTGRRISVECILKDSGNGG